MKTKYFPIVVAVFLSLVLSACGGGGASTTINVTMTDFHFEPMEFTVPAGQEITLNAVNNGAVIHEFVIFKLGTDAGEKFGDEDEENIYWEVEVEPGQSVTTTFTAPSEPGEYSVTCGIEGHLEAGMNGKLIVVAGQ
ncbi:MAG: cupredoxin domain-containing protein [Chloroflexota bacterium]